MMEWRRHWFSFEWRPNCKNFLDGFNFMRQMTVDVNNQCALRISIKNTENVCPPRLLKLKLYFALAIPIPSPF